LTALQLHLDISCTVSISAGAKKVDQLFCLAIFLRNFSYFSDAFQPETDLFPLRSWQHLQQP